MTLEIISPTGTLFHGEATRVTLPGTVGSFTVLQDHASLLSTQWGGKNARSRRRICRCEQQQGCCVPQIADAYG